MIELHGRSAVNSLEATAAERLNDLAETFHAQGMTLWLAVPGPEPLEVIRHAGQLHGRDDLEADTGRLGVRVFLRLEDADAAYGRLTGDVHGHHLLPVSIKQFGPLAAPLRLVSAISRDLPLAARAGIRLHVNLPAA